MGSIHITISQFPVLHDLHLDSVSRYCVYGEEWSFGYCERGSGVFSCPPKGNPMYTFRETIEMGVTGMGEKKVGELLRRLSKEWPGRSYDMLARNCNHFCDEFCQALGVGPTPVWVNRFAYAGDVTLEFYDQASTQLFHPSPPFPRHVLRNSPACSCHPVRDDCGPEKQQRIEPYVSVLSVSPLRTPFLPPYPAFTLLSEKIVGLTIDDGPNGKFTSETLDILKEHGCSATFFLIGSNIDKYPDLVERMVQDGHEVANHMMADYPGCLLSTKQFMASMLEVDAKLHRFFPLDSHGRQIKWFRPGYGFATPHMQHRAHSHGYRLALGSVFPLDPLFKGCGAILARFCLWKMYPGAIIILHDRPQQGPQTNHILRILLPELKQQGYRIVNLTELVNSVNCKEVSQVNGGKQD
ncbi:unnamed protein product [Closterium sp. NIES-53]